jgi:hypothetical protein
MGMHWLHFLNCAVGLMAFVLLVSHQHLPTKLIEKQYAESGPVAQLYDLRPVEHLDM